MTPIILTKIVVYERVAFFVSMTNQTRELFRTREPTTLHQAFACSPFNKPKHR